MNMTRIGISACFIGGMLASAGIQAAVSKTVWGDAPLRNFLFIENQEDNNLFVAPTDALDPRLTGANAWTSLKGNGQVSLAYVDNGYNTDINNWNVDMWEIGPIHRPYTNQRCIMTYTRCDPDTAEAVNKPAVVDDQGFYGLIGASAGWGHGKLSPSFFDYLRSMPVGSVLQREMNLCRTKQNYDAASGARCINQSSGNWYVRKMQHKKAGHIKFTQTNAISEVTVDSNGNPYVLPGSRGCENYVLGSRDGILCRFLDYNFNEDGSQSYSEPYLYTNVKNSALNSAIASADLQMSSDLTSWVNKGGRYNVSKLRGQTSVYLFMSSNFFKQVVKLGLQDQLTRNLINFNMRNGHAPESGYYEFSGTTEIIIKPRQFSVSILSSEGITNPYREGEIGKDVLSFQYNISDSGPVSADVLEMILAQDKGNPYQGYCTFYPADSQEPENAVPIPARLVFDSTRYGANYRHPIGCDRVPVDIRTLAIKDSQPAHNWVDPNGNPGITRFYLLTLDFDLTDPRAAQTTEGSMWEGERHQSGTLTIKGSWR
ncbi:hypothetical protein ACKKBJ_17910 [Aeromonas dhakensis]|uniref:hypothetical protein n=1 Tax=Aeromonas dhakensis TaxID=196024 RepID=UPI00037A6794|nr:hypothetical protein [Aeromonas dhakensis]QSR41575.1 hypothetical protein HUI95_00300 [Aeromonas dhakensis]